MTNSEPNAGAIEMDTSLFGPVHCYRAGPRQTACP